MKAFNQNDESVKTPLDLISFILLCFILTLSLVQLLIVIEGDKFHEQFFMNICWIISVMALLVVSQLKATTAITRTKKEVQQSQTTRASSYIRQGDDAELMDAK